MRIVLTRREAFDHPDGINISIVALARAMLELGHQVRIVAASLESRDEYQRLLAPRIDLPILALSQKPLTGMAAARAWWGVKAAIGQFDPDLVIHNEVVPVPMPGMTVQVVHDLERRRRLSASIARTVRRFSSRRADHVVATTSELRDALVRDLRMRKESIKLIPKCIDRQAYRGAEQTMRMRAILHAGTEPYKQPAVTIKGFGELNDRSTLLYVTGHVTPEVQAAVESLPGEIRDRVKLLGAASGETVRNLHGQVLIAAFPTRYNVPVGSATVMEAIAAGTPIVGSGRISRDLLQNVVNGLVTETSPIAMANAFSAVLNHESLWSQLSQSAIRLAERFDSYQVANQYVALAGVDSRVAAGRVAMSTNAIN